MAGLDGEVKLPLVGGVSKKALLIGGGAAVLVVGAVWWRSRSTPAAVDEAAAADEAALGDPLAEDLSGVGSGGTGTTSVGAGGTVIDAATTPVTTNPQWRAVAMAALSDVVDPVKLSAALGKYLSGSAIAHGSLDESLIEQARSAAADPPVDGPGGYPPAIRFQPATGQSPDKNPPGLPGPGHTPPPTKTPPKKTPPPKKKTYTVRSGDTLTSIGVRQTPKRSATALYNANKAVIEAAAHKHGHSSSEHGHWIFPGTVLTIP